MDRSPRRSGVRRTTRRVRRRAWGRRRASPARCRSIGSACCSPPDSTPTGCDTRFGRRTGTADDTRHGRARRARQRDVPLLHRRNVRPRPAVRRAARAARRSTVLHRRACSGARTDGLDGHRPPPRPGRRHHRRDRCECPSRGRHRSGAVRGEPGRGHRPRRRGEGERGGPRLPGRRPVGRRSSAGRRSRGRRDRRRIGHHRSSRLRRHLDRRAADLVRRSSTRSARATRSSAR